MCFMGERNHKNVINVPLFVLYIYTNKFVELLEHKEKREDVLKKMFAFLFLIHEDNPQ